MTYGRWITYLCIHCRRRQARPLHLLLITTRETSGRPGGHSPEEAGKDDSQLVVLNRTVDWLGLANAIIDLHCAS